MSNHHAKLLDCTLRDGAYLIDKKFGNDTINGMIHGLLEANIDIIEMGFLQNEGFGEGKTVYLNGADAEKFVPKDKQGTLFTVLADYSRYSVSNLDQYTGKSFDAVRACFFKKERKDVIDFCKTIKKKGYKVFVQPVDILGYTDKEIIDLIEDINEVEPYCFSIVDTFGSMYVEDLQRVFSLIDHNLVASSRIGFHSHNNMQMSNALSQEFLRMSYGLRKVVVDTTVSGMGRGAGNTPTELVAEYMAKKLGYSYDIDALLDIIDNYMDNIKTKCSWGYSTSFFIAGCYSAHVNNIDYLTKKSSIRSKDIRYILNKIGAVPRKRYHYDLLEQTYIDYLNSEVDDEDTVKSLKKVFSGKDVVIIAPGKSFEDEKERIKSYIDKLSSPLVVSINFIPEGLNVDYVYFGNVRRYSYWKQNEKFNETKKIVVSNITQEVSGDDYLVSFNRLNKCGWEYMENSTIMLIRLLDQLNVASVGIAGMDGYSTSNSSQDNYANDKLELSNVKENPEQLNKDISSMLEDFLYTKESDMKINFITKSKFSYVLEK